MDQINKVERNVLYVDDEQSSLNAFENLYRRKFNIITASSGQQGLEILKAQPVQVIISDQRMPEMTGVEFLKKVKNIWPDIKCILFTAFDDKEVIKEAINEAGIYWYLNKPFEPEQFEQIITNAANAYHAENKLKESEEKFRTLVTNTEELVYMIAKDGTFLLSEGKGLSKLGLKPGEVVGKSVFDLYKDFPAMLDKMEEAFNGESVILENKIGDNYFKNWYTPQSNQEGEIIGLLGLSINITEQKKAERQIMEHQIRLKELANDLTISEEKIRKQIAIDLHDDVGQLLASMRMQMAKIIDMEENPELIVRMKSISQGLLKSILATRAAIFDLSPPQLNEIGLVAATHDWMKEQIEQKHHIKTIISSDSEDFKLNENTAFLLFRSIKELMMNTVKHAKASQLTLTFKRKDNLLEIAVEDDGIGFDYGEDFMRLKSDSYGLFSIQERISDLGGLMEVDSTIDKGTKIKLTVPLNDKRA